MTEECAEHHLEQLITSACCVVAADEDVGSITIVANRRLTYHELARTREHAALCRVSLAMDWTGTVQVRRHDAQRGVNAHVFREADAHGAR